MMILGGFPVSWKYFVLEGHFSKWVFTECRSTRSPWGLEKIQGPIWMSKDHLVMKGLSKNVNNHEFQRSHYSVGRNIADPVSISTHNMFSLISVTPKPPESPYGATYFCLAENPVFQFFPLLISYENNGKPYYCIDCDIM